MAGLSPFKNVYFIEGEQKELGNTRSKMELKEGFCESAMMETSE